MQMKVYSIRDTKTGVFNVPFFQRSHGEAERSFHRLVQDKQSMVGMYPDDYDLYYIGEFDEVGGKMSPLPTPQHIVKAVMMLNNDDRSKVGSKYAAQPGKLELAGDEVAGVQ